MPQIEVHQVSAESRHHCPAARRHAVVAQGDARRGRRQLQREEQRQSMASSSQAHSGRRS